MRTFPAIAAVATEGASINTLLCRPGGNCAGTGAYFTSHDAEHVFAINETHGTWGAVRPIPGFAALPRGRVGFVADVSLSCLSAGNCTLGGWYLSVGAGMQPFVVAEKNGKWGRAQALPGVAALNTGKLSSITAVECFPGGNCTAAGDYAILRKSGFINTIFVANEKNGTWGKAERVPGSAVLGTNVALRTLSCGAAGDCSVGGDYTQKHSDKPFLATKKNGTWGKAKTVPGIQP